MAIGVGFICLLAPRQFYVGLCSGPVRPREWLFIFNGRCNFHKEELRCCDKHTSLRQAVKTWAQAACWLQPGGLHDGSRQRLSPSNDVHGLDKESKAQHAPSGHSKPSALGHGGAFKLQIPQCLPFFFHVAPVKRGIHLPGGGKAAAPAAPLTPQPTGPGLLAPMWACDPPCSCISAGRDLLAATWSRAAGAGRRLRSLFLHACPCRHRKGCCRQDDLMCLQCQPLPLWLISASEGQVSSRMGQERWQCPTCCSCLWVDSQTSAFWRH